MVTKREQFANDGRSLLNGSITAVATSLTVDDASTFPSDGNFRIQVESEVMLVTAVSTNTFTVVRGQESTTGATHADNILVQQIVTDESIRQVIEDDLLFANTKPLYHSITNVSGTQLTVSSFTWVNQGSATATDVDDAIYMTFPTDAATQSRGLALADPATPWTCTVGFRPFIVNNDVGTLGFPQINLGFRDSSTARVSALAYHFRDGANGYEVIRLTNATTASTASLTRFTSTTSEDVWMRISDNNTNHVFSVSIDGVNWVELHSEARTAWTTTPDQIFFGADPAGCTQSPGTAVTLFHYSLAPSIL